MKGRLSFEARAAPLGSTTGSVVAVGITKPTGDDAAAALSPTAAPLDRLSHGALARALRAGAFGATAGETLLVPGWKDNWVLLVGLGAAEKLDARAFRKAAAAALRATRGLKEVAALVSLLHEPPLPAHLQGPTVDDADRLDATVEGFVLGSYRFEEYRTKKNEDEPGDARKTPPPVRILFATAPEARRAKARIELAQVITEGQLGARDLANLPPNVATPARLAQEARALAKEHGLACAVLGVPELKRRKMHGILAVGQGSENPPRLILLEHVPRRRAGAPYRRVVLIGKGITFDTGGISIKPAERMELMKYDKAGACAVLAVLATVARLKLPLHVIGLAACAENMPSGTAYRPGDILTMGDGKTVEVLNTDAEGRMVLADALHHAGTLKPDVIIDLATLTGAIEIALGKHYTGLMSTDDTLAGRLAAAGDRSGERVWRMPIGDEYQEQIKGTHADLANVGGRAGGALTAAQFLFNFVPSGVPWAHLDIAGTAWSEKDEPEAAKGATGVGVRLVARFLTGLAE